MLVFFLICACCADEEHFGDQQEFRREIALLNSCKDPNIVGFLVRLSVWGCMSMCMCVVGLGLGVGEGIGVGVGMGGVGCGG